MNTATTEKKPRLTTSAMIASIASKGQRVNHAGGADGDSVWQGAGRVRSVPP